MTSGDARTNDETDRGGTPGPDQPAPPRWKPIWPWLGGAAALIILALLIAPRNDPASPPPTATVAATAGAAETEALPREAPTPHETMAATEPRSWLLMPPFPATATQADRGAEVYRLVCSTCHGSGGEGLSYGEWVKTADSVENCWQAKCHGDRHPDDGFALPRVLPPVVGPGILGRFGNALALYSYTRATMPRHAPGTLLDQEYWEVTAFMVRANGLDPMLTPLDAERAAQLSLGSP